MDEPARFTAPPHPAQRGLILAKSAGADAVNCTCAYTIRGQIDPEQLADAYRGALAAFDALRVAWTPHTGGAAWRGVPAPRIEIHRADLRGQGLTRHGEPSPALRSHLQHAAQLALDLATGPLAVIEILQLESDLWAVTETIDHAVADGRSLTLLHTAVAARYRTPGMSASAYPSYQAVLARAARPGTASRDYWLHTFADYDPATTPARRHRAAPARWQTTLAAEDAVRLHRAAGRAHSTLAAALLAAHAHAVARHAGTGDVPVFVAVDGRDADTLDVFGQLTALLPARIRHRWHTELGAHAHAVTRQLLGLREHLDLDADALDHLGIPVAITRPDATAFVIQTQADPLIDLPGATVRALRLRSAEQTGGLVTVATRHPHGAIELTLRAPAGSAFADQVADIGQTIQSTLHSLVTDPAVPLGSDLLLPAPARTLINQVATPSAPYPFEPVDHEITTNLAAAGHTPVLQDLGRTYTAGDLHARIGRLVPRLQAAGVTLGSAVSVGELDTIDRIAAFLAVLHLSAVYVPFDTLARPAEVERAEQRCQAAARITRTGVHPLRNPADAQKPAAAGPHAPAYIIFTSGTTGTPKGVVVSRYALANLVRGEGERFAIDEASRVLLIAPPVVDPWICHVAATLLCRATLVRVDPSGDGNLADRIAQSRATHAFLPAALVRLIADASLPELRVLATAGDHCRTADLAGFTRQRVFNIYGPTEATVTATVAEVADTADPVPIGTPIRGYGARILIDSAASAPPGAPGELVLSGAGIARGYLDDPELTRARFLPDPLAPGQRCYLTGDRAYLRADGQLVVTGRMDRQIKVRGTRVEPEAIEGASLATGLCTDAYAKASTPPGAADTRLALYVTGCADPADFTTALHSLLPPSAWPHHVVVLDTLPRRASGAIAEDDLPEDYRRADHTDGGPGESGALATAWAEVLGAAPRADEDFFAAGGDSLNVLRLVRHARAAGVSLSPADVYRHPRYADLNRRRGDQAAPPALDRGRLQQHPHAIPFGPAQQWFLAMSLACPQAWQQRHTIAFPVLPTARRLEQALAALLTATPILRAALDTAGAQFRVCAPAPVAVDVVDASLADEALHDLLVALHAGVDPGAGVMLRALALRRKDGSGLLVLAAHHLVVDVWSWDILTDRLRRILAGERVETDQGFAAFATAVRRQTQAGAFTLDTPWWERVLASGRTADLDARPQSLQRISIAMGPADTLARAWRWPASRVLPAALGHALAAAEGAGATVVDVERNGRAVLGDLDLSTAVGWIALHHPLTLTHAALTESSVARIAAGLDDAPDLGLSYGALRWGTSGGVERRIGRFAIDVRGGPDQQDPAYGELDQRIRDLRVTPAGPTNVLPYEATFSFLQQDQEVRAVMDFDPDRITAGHATALLDALAEAVQAQPARNAPRGRAARTPGDEPVPASAMQQLMLHHAAAGPGRYRPRQLIAIHANHDAPALLDALSGFLGAFDPFRLRFDVLGGITVQRWLPQAHVAIRAGGGGIAGAHAWLQSPDRVDAADAARGGALVDVVAFPTQDALLIGMEVHHAVMDGVSNGIFLRQLGRFVTAFPGHGLTSAHNAFPVDPFSLALTRRVVQKHVACELAQGLRPTAVTPRHPEPDSSASTVDLDVSAAMLRRVGGWARERGVDSRAALSAIVAEAARASVDAHGLQVVANGRDADVPGSATALGMFWYFSPVNDAGTDRAAVARTVYSAAVALRNVRVAATRWQRWPLDATSFNYTKQSPAVPDATLHVVARRDVFHFPTQVDATVRADGSALIRCTALGDQPAAQRLCDALADRLSL